jgi:hypothetical protein
MKESEFDSSIKKLAGPVVEPWGFNCEGGRGCTFRKQVEDELYHFISFDIKTNGQEFEVMVFPGTPRLGKEQWVNFPDFVGIPTGRAAGLNAKLGVGAGASRFPCKDIRLLETAMARAVLPALEMHALAYLCRFATVADIIPALDHPQWAEMLR